MRTFATMLAMTALAVGIQIEDRGKVWLAQVEDDEYELAQITDLTKEEAAAIKHYNDTAYVGGKNIITCPIDQSLRVCTTGTEMGCDPTAVCKSKTGYETAIFCTNDDPMSVRTCAAGTPRCHDDDAKLCGKPSPTPGGLKTI